MALGKRRGPAYPLLRGPPGPNGFAPAVEYQGNKEAVRVAILKL